jgi:hypothetical protein
MRLLVITVTMFIAGSALAQTQCKSGEKRLNSADECIPMELFHYLYCLKKSGGGIIEVIRKEGNSTNYDLLIKGAGRGGGLVVKAEASGSLSNKTIKKATEDLQEKLDPSLAKQCNEIAARITGLGVNKTKPPGSSVKERGIKPNPTSTPVGPRVTRIRVTTVTGKSPTADSDALVYLQFNGNDYGLQRSHYNDRKIGASDSYEFDVDVALTKLKQSKFALWHDNSDQGKQGTTPDWECQQLSIDYKTDNSSKWARLTSKGVGWLNSNNNNKFVFDIPQ